MGLELVSFLDALQYRYKPPGSSYLIHFVVRTNGRFDPIRMERSIQKVASQIPVLKSRYVCEDGVPKFWELLNGLPPLVTLSTEPSDKIVGASYDLEGHPPIQIVICRGPNSDDLVVSLDHVAMDAHGVCSLMGFLSETYRRYYEPDFSLRIPEQPTDRGFDTVFEKFSDEELRLAVQKAEEDVPKLLLWQTPFEDRLTNTADTKTVRRSLEPEDFVRARSFGKKCGGSVNDLLVAAYAMALFENGARGFLPIESVIDMRRYFPKESEYWLRNFGIVYFSPVEIFGTESFGEVVRVVGSKAREFKNNFPGVGDAVYYMHPDERKRRGLSLARDDPNYHLRPLFISNVGVIPESTVLFGTEVPVEDVYICANFLSDEYPALVACTWKDRLTFVANGTSGAELIEDVIERMIRILRDAVG